MQNIKLTIEYEGTRYQGWQRTDKKDTSTTISGKLTEALSRILDEQVELFCAARTESGVHASKQVISFKTTSSKSPEQIKAELNLYLPLDIAVLDAAAVEERFHASLGCISQTYKYRIQAGTSSDVFKRKIEHHLLTLPDVRLMREAANVLPGKHDFKNLSSGKKKKGTTKTIKDIQINQLDDSHIEIIMTADAFLHQMPRLIVSALIEIGYEAQPVDYLQKIMDGSIKAPLPVSPLGLTLIDVGF